MPVGVRKTAVVSASLWACLSCGGDSPAGDANAPPKPVQLATVRSESFTRTLVVPGIVEPDTRIDLSFRVSGHVAELYVDEGDRVEAGRVLAKLDLTDLSRELHLARAALDRAQASAREAAAELERQVQLYETRATSERMLDKARSTFQVAEADRREAAVRMELMADRLERGTLRAPVSGWIEARRVEPHEFAAADTPVFVLTVLDPITVRAASPDTAVPNLEVGAAASVRSSAVPDREFEGRVSRIALAADPESRTLPFEVEVPNGELLLRPEMAVEVEIRHATGQRVQTVPLTAVLRDANLDPFCFVSRGDNGVLTAERRSLVLGSLYGDAVTVASGLEPGERVVVRGQHVLRSGDPIREVGR